MSNDLYVIKTLFEARQFINPDEEITCLDGSLRSLTVGTNRGRVMFLRVAGDSAFLEFAAQLSSQNSPVSYLVHATAFGYILALISSKLYLVDKESRTTQYASMNVDVEAFALNTNPTVDNPFILQFALSTTDKQIIFYNLQEKDLTIENKLRVEGNAIALCYSRRCVCFATLSSYFVHDLSSNVTRSLFPYDSQTTRPIIINVGVDEFLLNGMQGLGVFATVSGISSRPPIVWGSEKVISLVCRSNAVFVLNTSSIIVFDCNNKIEEVQRVAVNDGVSLFNLDGQIVFYTRHHFCLLKEVHWFERAERMLSCNNIEEALQIGEDALCRSDDPTALSRLNFLKEKAALKYFLLKKLERCRASAIESGMDPRKFVVWYKNLLPLPSGFTISSNDLSLEEIDDADDIYLDFLESYLKEIRSQIWNEDCYHDIDSVLFRLMALREKKFDFKFVSELKCSYEDCETWSRKNDFLKYFLLLAICVEKFEKAFEIIYENLNESALDEEILEYYISNLTKISDKNLILKTLEFLIHLDAMAVLKYADTHLIENYRQQIIVWLNDQPKESICFLKRWQHLKESTLDTKLLKLYIDGAVKVASDNPINNDSLMSLRNSLRNLLLQSDVFDEKEINAALQNSQLFVVERVLVMAKKNGQTEKCLKELLRDYKDFDAAELLCSYFGYTCPNLYRILLKFYIRAAREFPKLESRITNLLNSMTAATTADMLEILDEVPNEWLFKRISTYTTKTILTVNSRDTCNSVKTAVLSVCVRKLLEEKAVRSSKSVVIDDQTCCCVCKKNLGPDDASFNFKSKTFLHHDCRCEEAWAIPRINYELQPSAL